MFGAKGLAAASLQSLVGQVLRMKVIVEWELHREIEVTPDQVATFPGLKHASRKGRTWRVLDIGGQATKGAWGMSRRQKAMKGVEGCEKLGGVVKQA